MAKTLYARGSDGLVSIHEAGADPDNPMGNLGTTYFNSMLDYMGVAKIMSGTLVIPARGTGSNTEGIYNLGAHGLSYIPMVFGVRTDNRQPLTGDMVIFSGGNASYSAVALGADGVHVYAREFCFMPDAGSPEIAIPYKIFCFNNPSL